MPLKAFCNYEKNKMISILLLFQFYDLSTLYFRTTATPNNPSNHLIFYGADAAEHHQNLAAVIKNAFILLTDDPSRIQNYYLCKSLKCSKTSQHDPIK